MLHILYVFSKCCINIYYFYKGFFLLNEFYNIWLKELKRLRDKTLSFKITFSIKTLEDKDHQRSEEEIRLKLRTIYFILVHLIET